MKIIYTFLLRIICSLFLLTSLATLGFTQPLDKELRKRRNPDDYHKLVSIYKLKEEFSKEVNLSKEDFEVFFHYFMRLENEKDLRKVMNDFEDGFINESNSHTYKQEIKNNYHNKYKIFLTKRSAIVKAFEDEKRISNARLEAAPPCTNMGFENGFTGWQGSIQERSKDNNVNTNDPGPLLSGFGQHCLMDSSMRDPYFPNLRATPPGKPKAVRLGNIVKGGDIARLSQTFNVTQANRLFTYRYAVVLERPSSGDQSDHMGLHAPHFQARLKTSTGTVINCSEYSAIVTEDLIDFNHICLKKSNDGNSVDNVGCPDANGNILKLPTDIRLAKPETGKSCEDSKDSLGEDVDGKDFYYRNWSTVSILLDDYIGQDVTVEFIAADCTPDGHLGYAYVQAECSSISETQSTTICPGSGRTSTITASPGFKAYKWTATDGGTITKDGDKQTVTISTPGTYTVTVTPYTDLATANCSYPIKYIVKQLCDPQPITESFCSTDKTTPKVTIDLTSFNSKILIGAYATGTIQSWHTTTPPNGRINNPTVVEATNNSKYYAVMKFGTTEYIIPLTITVNPKPDATFPNFPPFCQSATATHTIVPVQTGGVFSGTNVTSNGVFSLKDLGTFDIKHLIVNSFGCRDSLVRQAKVQSVPVVNVEGDSIVCNLGVPIVLPIEAIVGSSDQVTWTSNSGVIQNPTARQTTITLSNLTPEQIIRVDVVATSNSCPPASGFITIRTKQLPTVTVGNDTSICSFGGLVNFLAKGSVSFADSTRWDSPNIIFDNKWNEKSPASYSYSSFPQINTFDVKLTAKKEECPDVSKSFKVTINPGPKVQLPLDINRCDPNGSITINLTAQSNNADSIVWQTTAGTLGSKVGTNTSITLNQEGATNIVASAYKNGCAPVNDDMNITFEIAPKVTATTTPTCDSDLKINLVGNFTKAGTPSSGIWSAAGTGGFGTAASNLTNTYIPSLSEVNAGTASIKLTSTGGKGICTVKDTTIQLTLVPLPKAEPGLPFTLCKGETFNRTATTGNNWSFEWKTSSGTVLSNSATISFKPTLDITDLTLTVRNSRNCSTSNNVVVEALTLPDFTLLSNPVCPGRLGQISATLSDPTLAPFITGNWSYNNQNVSTNWNNISYSNIGSYTLELKNKGLCPVTKSIQALQASVPKIDIPTIYKYCYEGPDPYITIASNAFTKYEWYRKDTLIGNEQTVNVSPRIDTKYQLKVANDAGCRDSVEVLVRKVCPPRLFVPNVITPGSENINAGLHIFGAHYTNFEITIFNRWGEVIFNTKDPKNAWEGMYNNENMIIGNYPWLVTYEGDTEEYKGPYKLVGDVTIVR